MTLQQTVILDDAVVELHHNPLITNKPYLLKIHSYTDTIYIRMSEEEILGLKYLINTENNSKNSQDSC